MTSVGSIYWRTPGPAPNRSANAHRGKRLAPAIAEPGAPAIAEPGASTGRLTGSPLSRSVARALERRRLRRGLSVPNIKCATADRGPEGPAPGIFFTDLFFT